MPSLTIVVSNRDRLDLNSNITKWFIKSVQWQDYVELFELLVVDGGSRNYEGLKEYFENSKEKIPMRIIQHKVGELFERALLNNVGIRNAKSNQYILTTDVDILFHSHLISTVMENVASNRFIESRTLYIHGWNVDKIYKGEINTHNMLEMSKLGRIKKRSTAGGLQCTSIENWNKLKGFNESMIGWGTEDVELLERAKKSGLKIRWLGESSESIMVYHQPHPKPNLKQDLECQEKNKRVMQNIRLDINPNGWGGKSV